LLLLSLLYYIILYYIILYYIILYYIIMPRPLSGALSNDAIWRLSTSVAYIVNIQGAPTATGNKARWAPQVRSEACMGWSWAAACSVQGRGHIVAAEYSILYYYYYYCYYNFTAIYSIYYSNL